MHAKRGDADKSKSDNNTIFNIIATNIIDLGLETAHAVVYTTVSILVRLPFEKTMCVFYN